jgi:hypothetical protein
MRWVTYYENLHNVSGVVVHKDKESATKWFKAHCKNHFQLNQKNIKVELPMRYGFPFRAYCGESLLSFKRRMMERFDMTEKEFAAQLKECIVKGVSV